MADRSHLFFPPSRQVEKQRPSFPPGIGKVNLPPKEKQKERLGPKIGVVEQATLTLQQSAQGTDPEAVLVFEIVGRVADFTKVVRKAGLEVIMALEGYDEADDDFYLQKTSGDNAGERKEGEVPKKVYLTATSRAALQKVLSLYKRWDGDERMEHGFTRWGEVFSHLKNVRLWDARDRALDTGVEEDFEFRLEHGADIVPVEVEMFFSDAPKDREAREDRVSRVISEGGGAVTSRCELPEIRYHAVLAELPASRARSVLEELDRLRREGVTNDPLIMEEGVQFLRPSGQVATPIEPLDEAEEVARSVGAQSDEPPPDLSGVAPVVALFDGLPLQNHAWLRGRLIVDVEDETEATYLAQMRQHGTAMASLITGGDASADGAPLERPIYVSPIMRPYDTGGQMVEQVPGLVVDVVHEAVRRMLAGGDDGPAAPTVKVVNLSIGEAYRPFLSGMSPFARLLDWLAYEYEVLFVVSAGNYNGHPELEDADPNIDIFGGLKNHDQLEHALVADGRRDRRLRRIYAPAESLNALTVGAYDHDDAGGAYPPRYHRAYQTDGMPAYYSRQGPGPDRAIKPDVLNSGGRMGLQPPLTSSEIKWRRCTMSVKPPGHKVASPGPAGTGSRERFVYLSGTSNAAALTTRTADRLHDVLTALRQEEGGDIIDAASEALWLKALLVHSASWPAGAEEVIRAVLKEEGMPTGKMRDAIAGVLGFGKVNPELVLSSDDHRATLMGAGVATHGSEDVWSIPLPPSLSGKQGKRRLAITLAWFTPPPIRAQTVRSVKLSFKAKNYGWVARDRQADHNGVQRGTVHHEVFEGERVTAFAQDSALTVHVECSDRERDYRLDPVGVPYALLATIEAAPSLGVPVYNEVRAGVRAQARTQARV